MIRWMHLGVHGAGRTLGALLTGVFSASSAVNPIFKDAQGEYQLASGLLEGNTHQLFKPVRGHWNPPGCWLASERWSF